MRSDTEAASSTTQGSNPLLGRYLRQSEVLKLLRISRATFWRLRRQFPDLRPVLRLTQRVPLWDALLIERWIEGRRNGDG
jgi:predicted DNA-binding transcriptional regulator AlpA